MESVTMILSKSLANKVIRSRITRLQRDADNLTYFLEESSGMEFAEILSSLKSIESEIERLETKLD